MTTQEIEKLKAFCDEKGIEMIPTADRDVWEFKSKDIWDGVEFAECIHWVGKFLENGRIFPLSLLNEDTLLHCIVEGKITPSTESAYVEQLKAKAKELYGDIYSGQAFDCSEMGLGDSPMTIKRAIFVGWNYNKKEDSLSLDGFRLYMNGKWAKKIEEPIKANITSFTLSNPYSTIVFTTSHTIKEGQVDAKEFMNHIEESIETFLNR